jgi:biopolymer transport protein ExbD
MRPPKWPYGFGMKSMFLTVILALPTLAHAGAACPTAVTDAAKKAYPDATISRCSSDEGNFEVKLVKTDKSKLELVITAKGEIEETEEVVSPGSLPEAVTKAFAGKYGKAAILKAEKSTRSDKSVTYEVAWKAGKSLKEATFKADGTFVEEE